MPGRATPGCILMALTTSQRTHNTNLAEINITPFCDVLLVLLIIFMVTAPLLSQGVTVNMPRTKAPEIQRAKDDVIITLRKDGQMFLGEDTAPIPIATLEHRLKELFVDRKTKDLYLRADQEIRYGEVARVMALAKLAGIERIGMMTQPEGSTGSP
ncbi:MAG: biopolymer transporter ExbD [Deltaproteobacteria bacterium]|nr:biopolymer transporter ExbD [Deltaproteobacteria bacterium]